MTEFEAFAVDLARDAARVTLPLFRSDIGHDDKGGPGGFDPVTEADRQAEAVIRRRIAERYPDHGVIGEEYGADRPDAEHVWVLDPIDGTANFARGRTGGACPSAWCSTGARRARSRKSSA